MENTWNLILDLVTEKRDKLLDEEETLDLRLKVALAVEEVYKKEGKAHPSSYGLGYPSDDTADQLKSVRVDLAVWEHAVTLISKYAPPHPLTMKKSSGREFL